MLRMDATVGTYAYNQYTKSSNINLRETVKNTNKHNNLLKIDKSTLKSTRKAELLLKKEKKLGKLIYEINKYNANGDTQAIWDEIKIICKKTYLNINELELSDLTTTSENDQILKYMENA